MALLVGVLVVIPGLLQKWLWMRQLDYSEIFWTLLSVKWGVTCVAFIGAFLFLWINIRQAARNSFRWLNATRQRKPVLGERDVIEIRGILVSRRADANHGIHRGWRGRDVCDRLLYAMGHVSPLSLRWFLRDVGSCLGIDVGFYVFRLPFYLLLQGSLVFLTFLAIVGVACQYAYFELMRLRGGRQIESRKNDQESAVPHVPVPFYPGRCLDGGITWIGSTSCIPRWAWSTESDIRRIM